jgi:vacuolar iron transporter family protein
MNLTRNFDLKVIEASNSKPADARPSASDSANLQTNPRKKQRLSTSPEQADDCAKTSKETIKRFWENWQDEVDSAAEYRTLATSEGDPKIAQVYANLAAMEEGHISFWEERLRMAGVAVGTRKPSWRSRAIRWMAKHFGPESVLSSIAAKESADRNIYAVQPETFGTSMTPQEHWHALVLGNLVRTQSSGLDGGFLARLEGRHRAVGGNALRAAVLGANDGLCSNLSLVMGVAGASISHHGILMTGIAGLMAGACSMALGEWVSVQSSRELSQREIRVESSELTEDPKGEGEELQLIYEAKGPKSAEAREVVDKILEDRESALDALVREELGIDPAVLGGSPFEAAAASFVLYSVGAIIPILPFLLPLAGSPVVVSLRLSGICTLYDRRRDNDLYRRANLALGSTPVASWSRSSLSQLRHRPPRRRLTLLRVLAVKTPTLKDTEVKSLGRRDFQAVVTIAHTVRHSSVPIRTDS